MFHTWCGMGNWKSRDTFYSLRCVGKTPRQPQCSKDAGARCELSSHKKWSELPWEQSHTFVGVTNTVHRLSYNWDISTTNIRKPHNTLIRSHHISPGTLFILVDLSTPMCFKLSPFVWWKTYLECHCIKTFKHMILDH